MSVFHKCLHTSNSVFMSAYFFAWEISNFSSNFNQSLLLKTCAGSEYLFVVYLRNQTHKLSSDRHWLQKIPLNCQRWASFHDQNKLLFDDHVMMMMPAFYLNLTGVYTAFQIMHELVVHVSLFTWHIKIMSNFISCYFPVIVYTKCMTRKMK